MIYPLKMLILNYMNVLNIHTTLLIQSTYNRISFWNSHAFVWLYKSTISQRKFGNWYWYSRLERVLLCFFYFVFLNSLTHYVPVANMDYLRNKILKLTLFLTFLLQNIVHRYKIETFNPTKNYKAKTHVTILTNRKVPIPEAIIPDLDSSHCICSI